MADMYKNWPWFSTLVDLLEMILIKSEENIAAVYDSQLVKDESSIQLGVELRAKLKETAKAVLKVSGNASLQENNPVLLRSLMVRNPYVDPLNVIQAELLSRLRAADQHSSSSSKLSEDEKKILRDALLVTINGIANGMRNSG